MPETMPIACSLDQSELSGRARSMAELGESLLAVEADGRHASLRFPTDRHQELEDFVRAESRCCPFFAFELTVEQQTARLRVGAPEGGEWAVRGLVAGFVAGWGGLV
jgi:hypothetical protein